MYVFHDVHLPLCCLSVYSCLSGCHAFLCLFSLRPKEYDTAYEAVQVIESGQRVVVQGERDDTSTDLYTHMYIYVQTLTYMHIHTPTCLCIDMFIFMPMLYICRRYMHIHT